MHDYTILGEIGSGAMGKVYRARHNPLNRIVALKQVTGQDLSPVLMQRFMREMKVLSTLRHPSIVRFYDTGILDGQPFFTMELVEGTTLLQRMRSGHRYLLPAALGLLAQLAEALAHLHAQGICHRDIKPGNLMLRKGDQLMVIDFGLIRAPDTEAITKPGVLVGTPAYMAPEAFVGAEARPSQDVYALGVIAYELLTCRSLSRGLDLAERVRRALNDELPRLEDACPELPRWLLDLHRRCLAVDPEKRPKAEEVGRILREKGGVVSSAVSLDLVRDDEAITLADLEVPVRKVEGDVEVPVRSAEWSLESLDPPPPERGARVIWVTVALVVALGLLFTLGPRSSEKGGAGGIVDGSRSPAAAGSPGASTPASDESLILPDLLCLAGERSVLVSFVPPRRSSGRLELRPRGEDRILALQSVSLDEGDLNHEIEGLRPETDYTLRIETRPADGGPTRGRTVPFRTWPAGYRQHIDRALKAQLKALPGDSELDLMTLVHFPDPGAAAALAARISLLDIELLGGLRKYAWLARRARSRKLADVLVPYLDRAENGSTRESVLQAAVEMYHPVAAALFVEFVAGKNRDSLVSFMPMILRLSNPSLLRTLATTAEDFPAWYLDRSERVAAAMLQADRAKATRLFRQWIKVPWKPGDPPGGRTRVRLALAGLGLLREASDVLDIVPYVTGESESRREAVQALRTMQLPESRSILHRSLAATPEDPALIWAVSPDPDPSAPLLARVASTSVDPTARFRAIEALEESKTPAADAALRELSQGATTRTSAGDTSRQEHSQSQAQTTVAGTDPRPYSQSQVGLPADPAPREHSQAQDQTVESPAVSSALREPSQDEAVRDRATLARAMRGDRRDTGSWIERIEAGDDPRGVAALSLAILREAAATPRLRARLDRLTADPGASHSELALLHWATSLLEVTEVSPRRESAMHGLDVEESLPAFGARLAASRYPLGPDPRDPEGTRAWAILPERPRCPTGWYLEPGDTIWYRIEQKWETRGCQDPRRLPGAHGSHVIASIGGFDLILEPQGVLAAPVPGELVMRFACEMQPAWFESPETAGFAAVLLRRGALRKAPAMDGSRPGG